MADTKKVLMGDTTATAVGKINQGIENAENALLAVEAIEDKISTGGIGSGNVDKIIRTAPHDGLEDYEYLPDENKVIDLPFYTADEVDIALGNLAGGMRYMGTLGTSGTITALPTVDQGVKNGDTYKVITKGTYNTYSADVGDLFIAVVTDNVFLTWNYVPSGDDGDVYADSNFGTSETIIVAGNGSTDGKKVKSSGKSITTTLAIDSNDNQVPTAKAVADFNKAYGLIRILINSSNFSTSEDSQTGTTTYNYIGGFSMVGFRLIEIFNKNGDKIITDGKITTAGTLSFTVATSKITELGTGIVGGGVVIQKVINMYE